MKYFIKFLEYLCVASFIILILLLFSIRKDLTESNSPEDSSTCAISKLNN